MHGKTTYKVSRCHTRTKSSGRRTKKICEHWRTGLQHLAEYPSPRVSNRRGGDIIARVGVAYCHFLKRIRGLCCPHHVPPWSRTMTSTRTLAFAGRNYQSRGKRFTFDSRFRGERTLLSKCHVETIISSPTMNHFNTKYFWRTFTLEFPMIPRKGIFPLLFFFSILNGRQRDESIRIERIEKS